MEKTAPRFLFVFANSDGRLYQLSSEREALKKAFQPHESTGQVTTEWLPDATAEQFIDTLIGARNNNIVEALHFAGHANAEGINLESVQSTDGQWLRGPIAKLIAQQKRLKFVFLNACYTEHLAIQMIEYGIPCVLGTMASIDDRVAKDFATTFYKALLDGADTIEGAFNNAKLATEARHSLNTNDDGVASLGRDLGNESEIATTTKSDLFNLFVKTNSTIATTWALPRLGRKKKEGSTKTTNIYVSGKGPTIAGDHTEINQTFYS